jgi:shikimate kinase
MRIYLIGFMGCGKTTLGKRLASRLGYPFIDHDKVIEARVQLSIAEYFNQYGEEAFRKLENETIKTMELPDKAVIATGGGAPCFYDNLEWMNGDGLTIYLSLSPKALAERLRNATEQRPILKQLKDQTLEEFITERLQLRAPFYSQAKLTIKGKDQSPEQVIEILKQEGYLK